MKNMYLFIFFGLFSVTNLFSQTPAVRIGQVNADVDQVLVPIYVENVKDCVSIRLFIEFDSNVLTPDIIDDRPRTMVRNNQLPSSPEIVIDPVTGSVVRLLWLGLPARDINGRVFDLAFKFTGDNISQLNFDLSETRLLDSSYNPIQDINFVGGSVSPDPYQGHIAMTNATAMTGKPVTMPVTIGGKGFGAITSFSLKIEYDAADFQYVGVQPVSGINGLTATANNQLVTVNYNGSPLNLSSVTHVFDLTFIFTATEEAPLVFDESSSIGNNLLTYYHDGLVVPTDEESFLIIEDTSLFVESISPSGNDFVDIPILANDFSTLAGSIDLLIDFDNDQLTYSSFVASQLTNWSVGMVGDQLSISWTDAAGASIADGSLVVLRFTYSTVVNSEIGFAAGSLVREPGLSSLPVTFVDGSVLVSDVSYILTLIADPEEGGTVSGAGEYAPGTAVAVNATPAAGYAFLNWSTTDDEVVSENPAYSITMDDHLTLVAHFQKLEFDVDLTASPSEGGSVEGNGTYSFGEEVNIRAVAAEGYRFVNWTNGDGGLFSLASDYTFTMPDHHLSLTAHFELIEYTLSIQVSPLNTGTVTGAGVYNFNQEVVISATPNTNYKFDKWTDIQGNEFSPDAAHTFLMPSNNLSLVANFVRVYAVTFNVRMDYVDGYHHALSFNPDQDKVYVSGSMFDWLVPGEGDNLPMAVASSNRMKYSKTVHLETGTYQYNYYLNEGIANKEWTDETTRSFNVINTNITLDDWFGALSDPTGLDNEPAAFLRVYPNPATNMITIESSSQINEVRLVDMLGQLVFASEVNDYRVLLNVSDYKNSLYFLQVISNEGIETRRIQVLR